MVNATPAEAKSERTIVCTPTERATAMWSNLLRTRYLMARSLNKDTKHFWQASTTWWAPCTFRNESCWPAKLAVGRSSAVALLRTAT